MVAPQHDLARLAGRDAAALGVDAAHLGARQRLAAGVGDGLRAVGRVADGGAATALGQPVGGGDVAYAEFLPHARDEHRRHAGGAVTAERSDERSNPASRGCASIGQEQRGRPGQEIDAVGLDAFQHGVGIEDLMRKDRRPAQEGGDPPRLVAEGVEEGLMIR